MRIGLGLLVVAWSPCKLKGSDSTAVRAASTTLINSGRHPASTAFAAAFSTVTGL